MKRYKKIIYKIKFFFLVFLLLVFGVAFLLTVPKVVNVAENRVVLISGQPNFEAHNLVPEVAGVTTAPQIKIVDAGLPAPKFGAAAALAEDLDSGAILYQKNIHSRLAPASTTKLVAALVALDYFKADDVLVVTEDSLVGGSTMGLNLGERLTFRGLLYGMLLNSGNDAAFTIAANYPGGFANFVSQMNKKVAELGLLDSHFENPAGFDSPEHYSSAYDLAKVAEAAAKNPQLAKIVSTKETLVSSIDSSRTHSLRNLNKLLGEDGVLGIKTGFTEKSGENLVGLIERNGHKVLTVMLSSRDRFGETRELMDWVYANFSWQ